MKLVDVRCKCGKLLGRVFGNYEIKCPRCKLIISGCSGDELIKKI